MITISVQEEEVEPPVLGDMDRAQEIPKDESIRVFFIYGRGSTASADCTSDPMPTYLRDHFAHFSMATVRHTSDLELCISTHARHLADFQPDVVVTESHGGPIILTMISQGLWRGPTLMLCPTIVPGIDDSICMLRNDHPIAILAGSKDEEVPFRHIEGLWARCERRLGSGFRVTVVNDRHALTSVLDDESPMPCEVLGMELYSSPPGGCGDMSRATTLAALVLETWVMRERVAANCGYSHEGRFPRSYVNGLPHDGGGADNMGGVSGGVGGASCVDVSSDSDTRPLPLSARFWFGVWRAMGTCATSAARLRGPHGINAAQHSHAN